MNVTQTQLRWAVEEKHQRQNDILVFAEGLVVCKARTYAAALQIVRAVNAHAAMRETLKSIVEDLSRVYDHHPHLDEAKAALALAEN